jgi:hopene-associated glycosyltransferase HpnB
VPTVLVAIASISLIIWLYLAAARGNFWRLRNFDDDKANHQPPSAWPSVLAVVPARNEAAHIHQAVTSLLQQNYPGEFSVIVVDDHSEDPTAERAKQAAGDQSAESRFHIRNAPPLPQGWTGKLWALHSGTATFGCVPTNSISPGPSTTSRTPANNPSTAISSPAYYWFTDADIIHAPDTLHRLVARAERDQLDLTSLMVLLQAKTPPERALIPAFLFFFLKLYPPKWIANPKAKTAGAAGGCILLRAEALQRIGGLAAIRTEVIDDCALARAVKVARPFMAVLQRSPSRNTQPSLPDQQSPGHPGPDWTQEFSPGRIWMGLTRRSISLRAYNTFGEIRDMIARTAFTQLHYSPALLLGTIAGMFLAYLAPVALVFAHNPTTQILAACAWAIMSLLYLPTRRFYRLSPLWAPLLPAVAAFYSYATLLSATRYYLGRGAQWKGRSQAAPQI